MSHQFPLEMELPNKGSGEVNHDEEEVQLMAKEPAQEPVSVLVEVAKAVEEPAIIDPLQELVKNNDFVPLLAVLDRVDLTTVVEGKPLLSRLCATQLPLNQLLANRQIVFTRDLDNRTALHEAIAADDINSAYWCIQHKIQNFRDNFGNTPILQAIKLGRRNCFLLCLQYKYLDSEAAHLCAQYNRAWELKVLNRLGVEICWQRDSQHMTPFDRAVQNYSYETAEYLTELIGGRVDVEGLGEKTDSKGMIRMVKRIKSENNYFNYAILPLLTFLFNLSIIYAASLWPVFQTYQNTITLCLGVLVILQLCLYAFSCDQDQDNFVPDIKSLLKAPQFPPLGSICPHCLSHQSNDKQHCLKCKTCVQGFHYHGTVCVNKNNQIFWALSEITWLWIVYQMNQILFRSFQVSHLNIINFSNSFFFSNSAIVDSLWHNGDYLLLSFFIYLKIFLLYQLLCVFQWIFMMVLHRTYQEINHTERFRRLYKIGRTLDGNFKSEEIRLMERGLMMGLYGGFKNLGRYFFR